MNPSTYSSCIVYWLIMAVTLIVTLVCTILFRCLIRKVMKWQSKAPEWLHPHGFTACNIETDVVIWLQCNIPAYHTAISTGVWSGKGSHSTLILLYKARHLECELLDVVWSCKVGWAIVVTMWSWLNIIIPCVGDPRRPYPQDIEMRAGFLGKLSSSLLEVPGGETSQTVTANKKLRLDSPPLRSFPGEL